MRLYTHENPSEWLDFLPCAEWVYNATVHSTTRCAPASLVYTEAPLSEPVLDLAVGSQPFSEAGEEFKEHLRAARECMRKAQERQARNYDKRRSAVTFEPGDLVLVDPHVLRGAQDGDQTRKFAARWVGPFAVHARVNGLAYTLELPPAWRWHKTINVGFLKRFRESATFPRTLPERATIRGQASRSQDATEVLETRTTTRRGRTRQEFLVNWPGERQAQWISLEQLGASLPHEELLASLGPEGS